jgi:hypothetical protein
MAAIGLSATREVVWAQSYQAAASLPEGTVVVYTAQDTVGLPSGAGAAGVAGVVTDSGTVATGDRCNVQKAGIALVLLAAGQTVTIGQELVVANSSGHVKALAAETGCVIVGRSEQAFTAGSNADPIMCTLVLSYKT